MRNAPVFYRNLEEALDLRRGDRTLMRIRSGEAGPDSIDFSSLDILSLASSGIIRKEFLEELARHPDFSLGSGGSRLLDGNNTYIESTERDIAEFHNAETALLVHSGWEANVCLMAAIPRPGDAIVYDELIHSSFHEGMQLTLAPCKMSFKHNDVDDFRETLLKVLETQPLIKQGTKCVIICVESMYSMDGDCVALKELVDVAKEMFPKGNAQFIVDEAHTTGSLGHQGRGLVCELGLEKEIAIRMYTYGKAMATTGGLFPDLLTFKLHIVARLTLPRCNPLQPNSARGAREQCQIDNIFNLAFVSNDCRNPGWLRSPEIRQNATRKLSYCNHCKLSTAANSRDSYKTSSST